MIRTTINLAEARAVNTERKTRARVVRRLRQAGIPMNRLGHVLRGRVAWFDDFDTQQRVFFWRADA